MEAKNQEQPKQVVKYENLAEQVLQKIQVYQQSGSLVLPEKYSVENHLKEAWLALQEVKDRNDKPALQVCTTTSIANSLLDMVLQGLSVAKKQCYFVVYGTKLTCMRSYFGTVAIAKRVGGIDKEPTANIVYENDEFEYVINPETGYTSILKHKQKLENIDIAKIKAAYAIIKKNGETQVTIMTIAQIKKAWQQGATKGNSPAHQNFTDEMCKRTVIGRACKMAINSSDDAWLFDGKKDELDEDSTEEIKREEVKEGANKKIFDTENVSFEDISQNPMTTEEALKKEDKEVEKKPESTDTKNKVEKTEIPQKQETSKKTEVKSDELPFNLSTTENPFNE